MQCPNCSYKLVLLSNRGKYKCALCSKLYPQKEINNKEFRAWNKEQRKQDLKDIRLNEQKRLNELKQIKKDLKLLFTPRQSSKEYSKKWREKNREVYNTIKRIYWNKKTKQINTKRREKYSNKREQVLNYQKLWKLDNKYAHNLKRRLAELRESQKQLTLQLCKNEEYKLYTACFKEVLPSFVLAELLFKSQPF